MCVMHAPINRHAPKVYRFEKKGIKKRISFNKELLKPDVDFIDERHIKKVEDKGFFAKLFN